MLDSTPSAFIPARLHSRMKSPALLSCLLGLAATLGAHECWLQPSAFAPAPGAEVRLTLRVGMDLQGEEREFTPQRVASLRHYSAAGVEDWTPRVNGAPEFAFRLAAAGTHVIAYDSASNLITLAADKFHDYLREDGLEYVIALREKAGEAAAPGRERYRRCNKTILQAGGAADATWAAHTGQQIEIVPLDDPAAVRPGGTLHCAVFFGGRPLADTLILAWHRQGEKLTSIKARTSAGGEAAFTLPDAGLCMISTVHMVRTVGDAEADWASYWGNLTFGVADAAR